MSPEMEAELIRSAQSREQQCKRSTTIELLWIPIVMLMSWIAAYCL